MAIIDGCLGLQRKERKANADVSVNYWDWNHSAQWLTKVDWDCMDGWLSWALHSNGPNKMYRFIIVTVTTALPLPLQENYYM